MFDIDIWAWISYTYYVPGCGSAWLERLVWDQEVAGSNPVTPIAIVRVWFNGRTPAFQAGYVGSIPITRSPRGINPCG